MNVLVSVVMSSYNDGEFIGEAISSILEQTHRNLELLIINDGSTDNTNEVIERYKDPRIRLKSRENRGKVASLNEMLAEAKGDFIVMQDSDDSSRADRIEKLLRCFESDDELAMVLTGYSLIIDNKIVAPVGRDMDSEECFLQVKDLRLPSLDPTMMVRKSVARKLGFNADFRIGQGVDFIFRVTELYKVICLSDPLYNYRYNENSVTKRNAGKKVSYIAGVMNAAKIRRGEKVMTETEVSDLLGRKRTSSDNNLAGHFSESVYIAVEKGDRIDALRTGILSLSYISNGVRFAKPFVYSILPYFAIRKLRAKFGEQRKK